MQVGITPEHAGREVAPRVGRELGARDPLKMAEAMRLAVESGRLAFEAGRMTKKLYATASSPVEGVPGS